MSLSTSETLGGDSPGPRLTPPPWISLSSIPEEFTAYRRTCSLLRRSGPVATEMIMQRDAAGGLGVRVDWDARTMP